MRKKNDNRSLEETMKIIMDYIQENPGKTPPELGKALGYSRFHMVNMTKVLFASGELQKFPGYYTKKVRLKVK